MKWNDSRKRSLSTMFVGVQTWEKDKRRERGRDLFDTPIRSVAIGDD